MRKATQRIDRGEAAVSGKVRRVRGRPISEASREVLEIEIARLQDQVQALQDTIRLHNRMWGEAARDGAAVPVSYGIGAERT